MAAVAAHAQNYATPPATSPLPLNNGELQRWVGPHIDANGRYVPPHYETANKKPPFRGYFLDPAKRQPQRQHGYTEPAPDYTMPIDPSQMKPIEGR